MLSTTIFLNISPSFEDSIVGYIALEFQIRHGNKWILYHKLSYGLVYFKIFLQNDNCRIFVCI